MFSEWAVTSANDDFCLVVFLFAALALVCFIAAFYFFMRKRLMEDTPTSKIRSASQGYVELNGNGALLEGPSINSPLTGKICTWYSYKIEEHRSGKNSRWATLESGQSDELFLIVDDSGQCVIDPEGASVTPTIKDVWYGSGPRPSRGPGSGRLFLSGGRYRYTEKRMQVGEPLYAIGLFSTVGGAGSQYDASADLRELLKEWKQDTASLLKKFDNNKDGEIDMQEWQTVRDAALKQVLANHGERKANAPVHLMAKTHDRGRPYLLSAVPQESLIQRYQYLAIGLILCFFITGSFLTWLINMRSGTS